MVRRWRMANVCFSEGQGNGVLFLRRERADEWAGVSEHADGERQRENKMKLMVPTMVMARPVDVYERAGRVRYSPPSWEARTQIGFGWVGQRNACAPPDVANRIMAGGRGEAPPAGARALCSPNGFFGATRKQRDTAPCETDGLDIFRRA